MVDGLASILNTVEYLQLQQWYYIMQSFSLFLYPSLSLSLPLPLLLLYDCALSLWAHFKVLDLPYGAPSVCIGFRFVYGMPVGYKRFVDLVQRWVTAAQKVPGLTTVWVNLQWPVKALYSLVFTVHLVWNLVWCVMQPTWKSKLSVYIVFFFSNKCVMKPTF